MYNALASAGSSLYSTEVLIIGAGLTGAGIARDLALRGVSSIVVDRRDCASGATGANHGLLHSGARYVLADEEAAVECREESAIIKRIAPHCVEECGGYFVARPEDDPAYAESFFRACAAAGIEASAVAPAAAIAAEPALSPDIVRVFSVPDAAVDPRRLCLDTLAHAASFGNSRFLPVTRITGFEMRGRRIVAALAQHPERGSIRIEAEQYINAAGAWAPHIAFLAGLDIPMVYSKGTLMVTKERLAMRVINRLRPPGNGDILVPCGGASVLGTTSVRLLNPDMAEPTIAEVEENVREGSGMVPALAGAHFVRSYAGVRPLLGGGIEDRKISRHFALLPHAELENFITAAGGKITTHRLMAEKTSDLACLRLGVNVPCRTGDTPVPSVATASWPGPTPLGPQTACFCSSVNTAFVEDFATTLTGHEPNMLHAIKLRSNLGKDKPGGNFCCTRVASALCAGGIFTPAQARSAVMAYLRELFVEQRPILWGAELGRLELLQEVHAGLWDLERAARQALPQDKAEGEGHD